MREKSHSKFAGEASVEKETSGAYSKAGARIRFIQEGLSHMKSIERIAPEVGWLPISFVNAYFVGRPGESWALVDAGLPGSATKIFETAEARFGAGSKPQAIYLTHGHFDHCGAARELAERWDVPIYAHRMELPYLTGRSAYPPPDPTVGGAIAFLSRFFPSRGTDLGSRVRELPEGDLPGLDGWHWTSTPGHSPVTSPSSVHPIACCWRVTLLRPWTWIPGLVW